MKRISLMVMGALLHVVVHAQVVQSTTTADQKQLVSEKKLVLIHGNTISTNTGGAKVHIEVDAQKKYQTIEGFGYALTGGSAQLIQSLPAFKKQTVLKEIFTKKGIGVSYIRISMGASDLDARVFSYDDLPSGQTDSMLTHFSIAEDTVALIPTIKAALTIQPHLKIMASPWSPPVWMKTNGSTMGGHLMLSYYGSYAQYFVKYIQAMKKLGIMIHAVTLQNEPEHGGNNPSLLMTAAEQTVFVRDYLGPLFKKNNIHTEIVIYDHNADHPNYPIEVLNDPQAKSYISAAAFHLYLGEERALSKVHDAHPDKKVYFTEQWTGAKGDFAGDFMWHMEHIVLGTMQNWSSLVLEWNLAADASYAPHTPGGCTQCKGAFTIQGDTITKNVSYYIIAQVAKYIPADAIRTASKSSSKDVLSLSFSLQNGKQALLLINKAATQEVEVQAADQKFNAVLPANSASTFIW